jgi:hypothetical protein
VENCSGYGKNAVCTHDEESRMGYGDMGRMEDVEPGEKDPSRREADAVKIRK